MSETKKKKANNIANLIPSSQRTPKERREIAQKGGKASGVARAEKKAFKDVFNAILLEPAKPIGELSKKIQEEYPNITLQQAIALAVAHKACNGDVPAAIMIRDSIGEKPKDEIVQTINGMDKFFVSDD